MSTDRDARLARALADYLTELEAGRPPDRGAYLADRPDLAADLDRLLGPVEAVQGVRRAVVAIPADAGRPPAPVAAIGGYRVVQVIGRGGMGVVYEAVQPALDRRVAVKVLPAVAAADPDARQRFLHEARSAALLQHPHVVPVYEVGEADGVPFLVMQYVDGRSLAEVVRALRKDAGWGSVADADGSGDAALLATGLTAGFGGGSADPPPSGYYRRVARLGADAAAALAHAHAVGVLHRDVKPGNLLLDVRGHVWLCDFGLARLTAADPTAGGRVGTLRYMAPEQAAGGPADHRADVYGLGATLYELLALRPAFAAATDTDLLRQVLAADPPAVRRHAPAAPADLETVVLKAMAKDPADRYPTAQALADDLRRFLDGAPVVARPLSAPRRWWRWAKRRRRPALAAAAALLAGLIGGLAASTALVYRAYQRADRRERLLAEVVADINRAEFVIQHAPAAQDGHRTLVRRVKESLCALADEPDAPADARFEAVQACSRLAEVESRAGDLAAFRALVGEALDRLGPLLAADPDHRAYRWEMGRLRRWLAAEAMSAGDWEAAAEQSGQATALFEGLAAEDPGRASYRNLLGSCYLQAALYHQSHRADPATAIGWVGKALAVNEGLAREYPDHAQSHIRLVDTWMYMGWARAAAGDPTGAEAALARAVEIDTTTLTQWEPKPTSAVRGLTWVARMELGALLNAHGRYADARGHLAAAEIDARHLAGLFPAEPVRNAQLAAVLHHRGQLEYLAGDPVAARRAFADMVAAQGRMTGTLPFAYRFAGREEVPVDGAFDRAALVDQWRQAVAEAPEDTARRLPLGLALLRAGRHTEAVTELSVLSQRAGCQRATLGRALYALAVAYARCGKADQAREAFDQAERLDLLRVATDGRFRLARSEALAALGR